MGRQMRRRGYRKKVISSLLFQNVNYLETPTTKELVVFSCDQKYFEKYGIFNLLSCNKINYDVHLHLINATDDFKRLRDSLQNNLSIKFTVSLENVDLNSISQDQLKTYYYCSRFFIANDLFENYNLEKIYITDADVFFNNRIEINENISLALNYKPEESHLWRQVSAPFIFIKKEKKQFLKNVISEYKLRLDSTDFSILDNITDKYRRGDILGLDQVCLAKNLTPDILKNGFLNLNQNPNIVSKNENDSCVWIMTNQNAKKDKDLKIKLKEKINDPNFYWI